MKITKEEKWLIDLIRKLESKKCKEDLSFHAEAMVRAQEALKADYGITGTAATLFSATTTQGV